MKCSRIPGIRDLAVVTDPEEIRSVSNDQRFDRNFAGPVSLGNRMLIRNMLRIFSVNGKLFPTMLPRTDSIRAAAQDRLWSRLNAVADEIRPGPVELEPLAAWVRGNGAAAAQIGPSDRIGPLVQQSVGRLFVDDFTSTNESWAAACMLLEASSSSNFLKMFWWRITGRLERAKALLSSMVNGDLFAVNGIGIALHHIVDGLKKMRQLAADPATRAQLTADAVVDECLFAPRGILRLATTDGEIAACPFRKGSLFILALAGAAQGTANRDLVFLSRSWSRCPAESWVPALLEGVWRRASAAPPGSGANPLH
jgi:hypothetical protein